MIIGHHTISFFSQLMTAEEQENEEVEHMSAYLCEIALYHRDFVSTKPSIMARSSLNLARAILGPDQELSAAYSLPTPRQASIDLSA